MDVTTSNVLLQISIRTHTYIHTKNYNNINFGNKNQRFYNTLVHITPIRITDDNIESHTTFQCRI